MHTTLTPRRFLTIAVVLFAHMASAAIIDPLAPGPHPVGFTDRTFTKTSETTGQPRVLKTLIWYPEAPPERGGGVARGRWPLLIFSHGSCGIPDQSRFLMEALASWGMIVAAPPHPGNTAYDGFPQCGNDFADSFANRVADVVFVLDQMQLENATPTSVFNRHVHPRRIGIMGHSFGGQTVLRALAADSRFRTGLALAPAPATDIVVDQPLLVMTGELDSITPFEPDARAAFAAARRVGYLVRIADTGHCAPIPLCAPQFCGDGCPPDGVDVPTANQRVQRIVVPFAMRYVAGRGTFRRFLDPATIPPGIDLVEVTR